MDCMADFLEEKGQLKKEKSDLNIRVAKVVADHHDSPKPWTLYSIWSTVPPNPFAPNILVLKTWVCLLA